jgi:hypothetical protein
VANETMQVGSDTLSSQPNKSAKKQMSDEELLALIGSYERASLGSQVAAGATISTTVYPSQNVMTTLEIDRYNALNAYFARPLGNEIENRSQVVLPTLRDTIEWIMPQLMRMFVAAKSVVRFDAESQADEQQAEMETMVVNHIFMQVNNGFFVLHDFFKDALLMRNGYVEVYTKEETTVREEAYTGMDQLELVQLLQDTADEELEVISQHEYETDLALPVPQLPPTGLQPGQQPPQVSIKIPRWDLKIRRKEKKKSVCVTALPPEEMRVTPRAREGMEGIVFSMHQSTKARSDLITEGYDKDIVNTAAAGRPNWLEIDALARNQVVDQLSIENPSDHAMQEIELRKTILKVDFDGDGIAELRRVLIAGDKILENEVIEETPFVSCEPMRMPHRHTGISIYDLVFDLQVISSTLWRQGLDNLTISNNQRVAVDWRNCNFDDLLTSRPGGVVRGQGPPSTWIQPLETPSNLVQQVLPALEYIDQLRSNRTGIGKGTMGLDADELQNVTKGGQLASMSAAALIVELIARLLAEGVKYIFLKIHAELMRHQDKPLEFEISGKWVTVDPSQWRRRTKVTPNVGLGSGNQEQQRANVMLLGQAQAPLAQMGMVGPKQGYETFKLMCEALGFPNPERFAMDPASPEYQQHMQMLASQPHQLAPQVQAAQIRAQSEATKQQSEDQRKILELLGQLNIAKEETAAEKVKALQQQSHEALMQHKDREVDMDSTHADMLQTLIKAIAPIVAAQLKQDPSVNAGATLAQDVKAADSGLDDRLGGMLDMLNQHIQTLGNPRTATLPDGRQITIQ